VTPPEGRYPPSATEVNIPGTYSGTTPKTVFQGRVGPYTPFGYGGPPFSPLPPTLASPRELIHLDSGQSAGDPQVAARIFYRLFIRAFSVYTWVYAHIPFSRPHILLKRDTSFLKKSTPGCAHLQRRFLHSSW